MRRKLFLIITFFSGIIKAGNIRRDNKTYIENEWMCQINESLQKNYIKTRFISTRIFLIIKYKISNQERAFPLFLYFLTNASIGNAKVCFKNIWFSFF